MTAGLRGSSSGMAAAEAQGHQGDHRVAGGDPHLEQKGIVPGHGRQRQAGDDHAGNRAAAERQLQGRIQAFAGRLGDAHVGDDRHPHPDVACQVGRHGPDQEADRRRHLHGHGDDDENDDSGNADAFQLAVQIGDGAFRDRAGDLLHPLVSGRSAFDHAGHDNGVEYAGNTH